MSIFYRLGRQAAVGILTAAVSTIALADNPAAVIAVNADANRHAISPLIYGANWVDQASLSDLNLSVNRRGGNATSNYNWQVNATNRSGDWYFESLGDSDGSAPSAAPDAFITATKAAGAEPMITIPMMDWIAKLGPNRAGLASFSITKYGAQTSHDPWFTDAGNGVHASDGTNITGNDPNDAYVPNTSAIQKEWVRHLVTKFGGSSAAGLKYYLMDNEHGVWPAQHRDLMTQGPTMDVIRDKMIEYAGVVKELDPSAQIVGPEEWGWPNYFKSPYDTSVSGDPDRNAHGGMDYLPWLLAQLKAHQDATGKRLLDVFSLHYYPQYNEFGQGDGSTAAQLKRNECTRDLWDSNYVSSSWIGSSVHLIPRMKDWINTYYPGTKLAITEYSWGAEGHISGAIAEADVLGVFGREGVDLATFWGGLNNTAPIYQAFKIYRNYDGNKSTFGDTSVWANVANPDNVAAFAAQRSSDGSLTVMVVCKYLSGNTPISVQLSNFAASGATQVWQLTSANTISRLADATVSSGTVSFNAPSQSVTLLVIPGTLAATSDAWARYAFEGDVQDTSGNGFNGTATAVTYTTGKIGAQAAAFNGSSSYVSIPRSVSDDFTAAMWVKTTDTAGGAGGQWWSGKALVDGEMSGGGADWGTSIVNGKFVLGVGASSGDVTVASSVAINDGTWHHIAATRNNTSGAMAVYVDGVLRGTGTGPTGSRTWPPALRIGALQNGAGGFLNGALDDVRLYDRILSASEIAGLASVAPPVAPTGLAGSVDKSGVALNWSASPGAFGYFVKRATTSGGGYVAIGTATSTTFTDANANADTTHYYVVSAVNTYGESANSGEAVVWSAVENWRLQHFGTTSNSGNAADDADPDGDGWTNHQEYVSGTDPNDATSVLKITQLQVSGNDMIISFPSVAGKSYRVERSYTLEAGSWATLQDGIAGTGETILVTDTGGAGNARRFYRLVVTR